jgi:myosin heavy subunit
LDEQARVPKASDQSCLLKMHKSLRSKAAYSDFHGDSHMFQVTHYAGNVTYLIDGFMSKNMNAPLLAVSSMMQNSGMKLVNDLYIDAKVNARCNPLFARSL